MALMPPFFLGSVAALGVSSDDGSFKGNATGFLYGHPTGEVNDEGQKAFLTYLITNRHVLEGARERKEILHARFNMLTGTDVNTYRIDPQDKSWTVHSDPAVDVAVLSFDANKLRADGIEFTFLRGDDHALSLEEARKGQVSEGDGVFVLGFPLGLAGKERNYVIARQGMIALIQPWLKGHERTFMIDAFIFPGNSGGPVFLKPELASIEGTKPNSKCSLIGMVSAYLPYQEIAISTQTNRPRMIFEENSGLATVVPHDVIEEVIQAAIKHSGS